MTRVFMCGPYSATNVIGVLDNMRRGMVESQRVLAAGYAVFCPWHDYHYSLCGETTLEQYRNNSLAWLAAADVVYAMPGWEHSEGCVAELHAATHKHGIPIVYSLEELQQMFPTTARAK